MSNNLDNFVQLYLEEVPNASENELIEEYQEFKKQFVSMYGGGGCKERIKDAFIGLFIMIFVIFYGLLENPEMIRMLDDIPRILHFLLTMNGEQFLGFIATSIGTMIVILLICVFFSYEPPRPPAVHSAEWLAQERERQEQQQERIREREERQRQRAERERRLRQEEQDRRGKTGGGDMLLEAVKKVNLDNNKLFMKGMVILSNLLRKINATSHNKQIELIANKLDYIIDHPKNVKEQLIKLFKPVRAMTEEEYSMIKEILEDNKEIELNVMKMLKN